MKRLLFILSVAVCALACSKSSTQTKEIQARIRFAQEKYSLDSQAGSFDITFSSVLPWSISVPDTCKWLSVSPTSGNGGSNEKVNVSYLENTDFEQRHTAITITSGDCSESVTLTQKKKEYMTCSAGPYAFDSDGGIFFVEISSNVEYEYEIDKDAESWIKFAEKKRNQKDTLSFFVTGYYENNIRSGGIVIKSTAACQKLDVSQCGGPLLELSLPSSGGSLSTYLPQLDGNSIEFLPESASNWLSASLETCSNSLFSKIEFKSESLPSELEYRSASVIVRNSEKMYEMRVMQQDVFKCDTTSYDVAAASGDVEISFETNVDINVNTGCDWLEYKRYDSYRKKLVFNIADNTKNWDRLTELRITLAGNPDKFIRIRLRQAGGYYIYYHTPFIISSEGEWINDSSKWVFHNTPNFWWGITTIVGSQYSHTYYVERNDTDEARFPHTACFFDKGVETSAYFLQMPKTVLSLTQGSHTRGAEASYFSVGMPESLDSEISISNSWISTSGCRSFESSWGDYKCQYFRIEQNDNSYDRSAIITFRDKMCGALYNLEIIQNGSDGPREVDWTTTAFTNNLLGIQYSDFTPNVSGMITGNHTKSFSKQYQHSCAVLNFLTKYEGNVIPGTSEFLKKYGFSSKFDILVDDLLWYRSVAGNRIKEQLYDSKKKIEYYGLASGMAIDSKFSSDKLNIDLSLYFKEADDYKLMVFVTEDNVALPYTQYVSGYVINDTMLFHNVVRLNVTDLMQGEDICVNEANSIKYRKYSVTLPSYCKNNDAKIVVYTMRRLGEKGNLFNENHGDWYVDNCAFCTAGARLNLGLDHSTDRNGDADPIIDGGDIDVQ